MDGGTRRDRRWRGALVALMLPATWAGAQSDGLREEPEEARVKPKEGEGPEIRPFGRILARMSLDERSDFTRDLKLQQARIGLKAALPYLDAEVTADVASRSLVNDAYVRVHDEADDYRLYAGRFRAPFMARALESAWDLPLIGRGMVEDYLVEANQLGGRRLGAMGEAKLPWSKLRVFAGLFQGGVDGLGDRLGEDFAARVTVRPFDAVTFGASTHVAEVFDGASRFGYGGDVTLRLFDARLTAEVLHGRLPLGHFLSGTALLRYDLELGHGRQWLVQPQLNLEALHLRGDVWSLGYSGGGGVSVVYADRFRVQVQLARGLLPGDQAPANSFTTQVGARF